LASKLLSLLSEASCAQTFHWEVCGAQSGASFLSIFSFCSGHGTQVPNKTGTETDSLDEAIVPTDMNIMVVRVLMKIF
jgi:hypothetical protein